MIFRHRPQLWRGMPRSVPIPRIMVGLVGRTS
jgi:hypothetical protein